MNECSPRMSPVMRLALLAVGVGAAFSTGAIVGTAVGPLRTGHESSGEAAASATLSGDHEMHDPEAASDGADDAGADGDAGHRASLPGGVLISQSGYSLQPETTALPGLADTPFGFTILGPDGATVQAYETRHERDLHLVVVGRDLLTYHHLHPQRDAGGRWSIPMPALSPGLYRAFASFAVTGGPDLTLGTDLLVPGAILPFAPLPEPAHTVLVDGGYIVTMTGSPVAGVATEVGFTVERDGAVVPDLEPYLGAWGHLVALRAGDLAYNHVHPVEVSGGGEAAATAPDVVPFMLEVLSPGDYRLFFDYAHEGAVHTAAFTVHVPAAVAESEAPADSDADSEAPAEEPSEPAEEPTTESPAAKAPKPSGGGTSGKSVGLGMEAG